MSDAQKINSQRQATLICGVLGVVAVFLPWYDAPSGWKLGILTVGGVLALLACGAAVFLALFQDNERSRERPMDLPLRGGVFAAGIVAALAPFLMTGRPNETDSAALLEYESTIVCAAWYAAIGLGVCIALTSTLEIPGVSLSKIGKLFKRGPNTDQDDDAEEEEPKKKDPNRPRRVYVPKRK
jgi:drug/metabolite transporter (DMT)-like permease